ncbi:hypothetical protein TruAng_000725 [Truncatella angustata]|nr:hypothetical protein TruAng_000725 [Truncatella angustata]
MLPKVLIILFAASGVPAVSWITSGTTWYDTSGNKIDAHGGGIFQRGSTFYWIGHSAPDTSNVTPKLYTSNDLLNWKYIGEIASSATSIWRPKLAKPNGNFWIYGQQDREALSLKSASIDATYSKVAKAYLPPNSYSYSDTGMFYDSDSSTYYLLTSADHNVVQINMINSDGSVGSRIAALALGAYEAPGILKQDGVYFLIASAKTGYRANPNKVFYATTLSGPWSGGSDIANPAEKTYNSQNTFELTIKGSSMTTHIYMGDEWDSKGGSASNYIWLPLKVDSSKKTVWMDWHDMWKIDVNTGVVSFPTTKKTYAAEHSQLSKRSGVSEVTFRNVSGTGSLQWLRLHYRTVFPSVSLASEAFIIVNDNEVFNMSELNSRAGYRGVTPIQLKLRAGDVNTVSLYSDHEDIDVDVHALEVFEDDFHE